MIDIEKWKENIEAEAEEKEIRNCRRAVELYGKVDVLNHDTKNIKRRENV